MGLFSRGMNTFANVNQDALPDKAGKWYKRINTIAIVGIFAAVAIIVLSISGIWFKMSAFMFGVVGTIAILCAGLLLSLPWVNKYEKGTYKKLALVFIIFYGVCALLWLVCLYLGIGLYNGAKAGNVSEGYVVATANFVKISLLLSLQLMLSSVVATGIIKYKKSNYFLQGIAYASYAFFDFYFTYLLFCINFNAIGTSGNVFSESIKLLGSKYMIVFLVLAVIFIAISNIIMNRDDNRKMQQAIVSVVEQQNENGKTKEAETKEAVETPEEKLAKLKKMYDNELITKEEYESKKADILKEM